MGDDALIFIADALNKYSEMVKLRKIDFGSSRVGDAGLIYFLEKTESIFSILFIYIKLYYHFLEILKEAITLFQKK